jgi:hypothetical protein
MQAVDPVNPGWLAKPAYSRRTFSLHPIEIRSGWAPPRPSWAIKRLRDDTLPLFAAATAREEEIVRGVNKPAAGLRPMTAGGEVVEDYRDAGRTLWKHQ